MTMEALLETVGSLTIAVAAAACTGIANLHNSPLALLTICCCGVVISPFALIAGAIMCFGLLCCLPVVLIGLTIAWLPTIVRFVLAAVRTSFGFCFTAICESPLAAYARANPNLTAVVLLCSLPLLPVALVRFTPTPATRHAPKPVTHPHEGPHPVLARPPSLAV